jgi:NADH-quinone oxidoreductase subunit N
MIALDNVASLREVLPEAIVGVGALVVIAVDLVAARPRRTRAALVTLAVLAAAAVAAWAARAPGPSLFGGLLAGDALARLGRALAIASSVGGVLLLTARGPGARDRDAAEQLALVLGLTLGMSMMAAATELLTAFLALEATSLGSYALAGMRPRSRASSEAALKYVVYGGVAAGVMLFGMSLLYGMHGSTRFDALASIPDGVAVPRLLAVVLCLAGFAYKIAAVPFHMWAPDVYEGAPTPVAALFSVGPKAAGMLLLLRFVEAVGPSVPWELVLGTMAAATMTLGTLAAMPQTNLKRLLAYSSIAHAGTLLLAVVAGGDEGRAALSVYLIAYLVTNLGAFGVVAALERRGVAPELLAWRGLARRAPAEAWLMTLFLFSLVGLPPLAGFFGKYVVFAALVGKGGALPLALVLLAVLLSAASLFPYARVLRAMFFDGRDGPAPAVAVGPLDRALLYALALPTVALFAFL